MYAMEDGQNSHALTLSNSNSHAVTLSNSNSHALYSKHLFVLTLDYSFSSYLDPFFKKICFFLPFFLSVSVLIVKCLPTRRIEGYRQHDHGAWKKHGQ